MHGGDVWREGAPGDWLDFSANIRPGGPPEWVRRAMLGGMENAAYYPDRRMARARAALGRFLGLGADWVLPTAGGISAISLAARLAPELIVFGPCFGEYAQIAENLGVRVRELSLSAEVRGSLAPTDPPPAPPSNPKAAAATHPMTAKRATSCSAPEPHAEAASTSEAIGHALRSPSEAPTGSSTPSATMEHCNPLIPADMAASARETLAETKPGLSTTEPALCTPSEVRAVDMVPGSTMVRCNSLNPADAAHVQESPVGTASNPKAVERALRSPSEVLAGNMAPDAMEGHCDPPNTADMASAQEALAVAKPIVSANRHALRSPSEALAGNTAPGAIEGHCDSPNTADMASAQEALAVAKPVVSAGRHALRSPSEALPGNMAPGAAVWLCNPLNPVGVAFPRVEVESLLRQVEAAEGWLVLDEAFVHCCPERTSVDLLAEHPRLVIVGSLTKSLGIPGVRAGYVCAQPELLAALAQGQLTWELSCFAEAVIRALPEHAAELRAEAALNAVRRKELRRGLEALGAYVYPSEANFLLADFGRDVAPLADHLRTRGVLVRQCGDFRGIDDGCHLRLAVKDEEANARLVEVLREALSCAKRR